MSQRAVKQRHDLFGEADSFNSPGVRGDGIAEGWISVVAQEHGG